MVLIWWGLGLGLARRRFLGCAVSGTCLWLCCVVFDFVVGLLGFWAGGFGCGFVVGLRLVSFLGLVVLRGVGRI